MSSVMQEHLGLIMFLVLLFCFSYCTYFVFIMHAFHLCRHKTHYAYIYIYIMHMSYLVGPVIRNE